MGEIEYSEHVVTAGLPDDPGGLGLEWRTVRVATPLGDCPAWFVPAPSPHTPAGLDERSRVGCSPAGAGRAVWVIAVHGRGVDRRECLRILPTLHRLGFPVLAITYRNDLGAPASPDGHYHLGDTEWLDLASAAEYARRNGASELVLYGWSMGAAITSTYLDRARDASPTWAEDVASVRAVVWDSPLLDWRATLHLQALARRLPSPLTLLATLVTKWRIGIDFDQFDMVRKPPSVRPPTLMFHGDSDTAVPVGPARALAGIAEGLDWPLRYREVTGAEHTAAWNVDPAGYDAEVAEFLSKYTDGTMTG